MGKSRKALKWRARFLRALAHTGNAALSALQAGIDKSTAYNHRKADPAFAARWGAAAAEGKAAAAAGKRRRPGRVKVELVMRNTKRGAQQVRAARGRWRQQVEDDFFAALERTACVRWAAAAAGLSSNALYYRRRHYPDFARRWDARVKDAEQRIPGLLTAATIASLDPEIEAGGLPPVSTSEAIAIARLKGLEAGAGARGSAMRCGPPEPSIEEVRDDVLRRIAEIKRHRERKGGQG